ncbi:PQQ-binding-like beta-propeller repeat protein [Natrialbaceae archaeon GCM10025896]
MIHYDAANTLTVPHDGLETDEKPEVLWTADLEGNVAPPVVYNDTAYVGHGDGIYTAVDLTDEGEPLWHHETGRRRAPAAAAEGVFVAGDSVEALEHGGDVRWTSEYEGGVESLRIYDGTLYAGFEDRVIAYDVDGEDLLEFETEATVQSLAVDDEHVYVRSRPDPDEDDFVMAGYDRNSGDDLWEHDIHHGQQWVDDRVTRTFPVIDGTVYTVNDDAVLSIDGSSGELTNAAELEHASWTRPTVYDDTAYLQRGSLAYDLETGKEPSEWDPDLSADTPFIIAGEVGYSITSAGVLDPHELLAVGVKTGEVHWEKQAPERTDFHFPLILNDIIIIPEDDNGLVAFG